MNRLPKKQCDLGRQRAMLYIVVALFLVGGFFCASQSGWRGSSELHTLMEVMATMMAFFAGTMTLIRYYSKKSNSLLLIGTGFIGTGLLDGYHAVVTSSFCVNYLPSGLQSLIPWSWVASRFFLSFCMYLSWIFWRREKHHGEDGRISETAIYVGCGLLNLAVFLLFAFAPLPRAYIPEVFFYRPAEFVPAALFGLALIGYANKGTWRTDQFESWLMLSLLVGFVVQILYMPRSAALFDAMFDVAHLLKIVTYGLVLIGSLISMYGSFRAVATLADDLDEREQRLQSVLDTAIDGIITIDENGIVDSVNPATETMFGYTGKELVGKNISMLMPPPHRNMHDRYLAKYRATGAQHFMGQVREVEGQRSDGTIFPIAVRVSELKTSGRRLFTGMVSDLTERQLADRERDALLNRLLEASRRAGMADMATGVLHNVGNVLNSVNVSANCMTDQLRTSHVTGLVKACQLLNEHANDLGHFLTRDEKGKRLPGYLSKLSTLLTSERDKLSSELAGLIESMDHIKEIVAMQQSVGRLSGIEQQFDPIEVVEDAIKINFAGLSRHGVEVIREYDDLLEISTDKHKVLQILVNLISNAKHALKSSTDKRTIVRVHCVQEDTVEFQVEDTGEGIPNENLTRIFSHGFTTKNSGHGYGLHSAALAAKELGGSLTGQSDGPGKGATFTLSLPMNLEPEAEAELEQCVN